MQIHGWFIEGFGVFRDYEVQQLSPGLTVFLGPNEAGKSTLLAFLRGMLFGFPDARTREQRYPPLRGGRHGGRLTIATGEGRYGIDRQAGRRGGPRITRPNGAEGSDVDLRRLLGGADDRLFRSVFAFSLTELQSFETLTAEGVRDKIFSAGIAGAGRSARDAMRELDARATAISRSRGSSRVARLLTELAEVTASIDEAAKQAGSYLDRLRQEEETRGEIEWLAQEAEQLRQKRARDTMLIELWPAWHEFETTASEIDGLEVVEEFPAGAEVRLAEAQQLLRSEEHLLAELRARGRLSQARRSDIVVDEALAAVSVEAEQLYETLALHRSLVQQLPTARLKLIQTKDTIDDRLRSLGPDWDEARIEAFDRSIPRLEEVRAWEQRQIRAQADLDRGIQLHQIALRRMEELEQLRARTAANLGPEPLSTFAIEEHMRALRRLRTNLVDVRATQAEAAGCDALVKDRERSIRALDRQPESRLAAVAPLAVWMLAVLAIAVAVWRASWGDLALTALFATAAVICGIAGVALNQRRQQVMSEEQQLDVTKRQLLADLDLAASEQLRHETRAHELSVLIAEDAAILGLPMHPAPKAVEECDAELMQIHTARLRFNEGRARLTDADAELQTAEQQVERARSSVENLSNARAAEIARWDNWKRRSGIPADLSPQGVLDYFEAIRVCRDGMQARRTAKSEAVDLAQQIGDWEERAHAALGATGITEMLTAEPLIEQVIALRRRCQADRVNRQTAQSIEEELRELATKVEAAEGQVEKRWADRDRLFQEGSATDESSFRRRLEAYQQRQILSARLLQLERQVVARLGHGEEAEALRSDLSTGRVDEWRQEIQRIDDRLEQVQGSRDAAIRMHRDAQHARLALEESVDLARLETERAGVTAELKSALRQWRLAALARALIDGTLREFERTRQPEVLAQASRTFAAVTGGRYDRLAQQEEGQDVAVIDCHGGQRPADALSRGTAEQLYLCIRLALASEFARRSEPLPLIMDDVFVNFDPDRARSIAAVVAEFARSHQVLLFTCHPSTRDLLLDVEPSASVHLLQSQEPIGMTVQAMPPAEMESVTEEAAADPRALIPDPSST